MPRTARWPGFALPLLSTLVLAAQPAHAPLYSVVLASSTTRAIHYPFLSGSTLLDFQGTALDSGARGEASIRARDGRMRIHAHFRGLGPASRFGPEYMTYVLWAISPIGRPTNLGEVVVKGGHAHVEAQTQLQTFGLIVSAEPHYAVTRVSGAVVLENAPLRGTRMGVEEVEARFELLGRGAYALEPRTAPSPEDARLSPYVLQARNAVRIAQAEQADAYAPSEYQKALEHLERMESKGHLGRMPAVLLARRAIEQAEDARLVAEKQRLARMLALEQEKVEEARGRAEAARAMAEAARDQAAQEAMRASRHEREASEAVRKATEAQLALRRELMDQLNRLLQTRETEEGLMATLTDVAFPSGRSGLSAPARVNLAKVAGILLAHPGLKVRALGHTDSTGSPAFNERLSRARAEEVRRFLVRQGLPPAAIQAQGLDGAHPVASNDTAQGRRLNRRVDLIVSGEPIGI